MDFDPADEQKMTHAVSRQFGREVIASRAQEIEAMGEYLCGTIDQMAERGMMGTPFPGE